MLLKAKRNMHISGCKFPTAIIRTALPSVLLSAHLFIQVCRFKAWLEPRGGSSTFPSLGNEQLHFSQLPTPQALWCLSQALPGDCGKTNMNQWRGTRSCFAMKCCHTHELPWLKALLGKQPGQGAQGQHSTHKGLTVYFILTYEKLAVLCWP